MFLLGIGLLLQAGAPPNHLIDYGERVQAIVRNLNPVLIYFRQSHVAAHVQQICAIRGAELERELIANMERTPFFKGRGLKGLAGVAQLWDETQQISDALFSAYTIRKLALETAPGDWHDYRRQIMDALSLPMLADWQIHGTHDLARLAGRYWRGHGEHRQSCEVVLEAGRLHIRSQQPHAVGFFGAGPSRELIPIDGHSFYAGIAPVVIAFVEGAAGDIQAMRIDSTRLGGGEIKIWMRGRS